MWHVERQLLHVQVWKATLDGTLPVAVRPACIFGHPCACTFLPASNAVRAASTRAVACHAWSAVCPQVKMLKADSLEPRAINAFVNEVQVSQGFVGGLPGWGIYRIWCLALPDLKAYCMQILHDARHPNVVLFLDEWPLWTLGN